MKRPSRDTLTRVAAAAASGVLLALSRPPFDIGPLACVALIPLFLAWRERGPRATAGLAFVAGAVYYGIVCSWIWYFGAVAIVPFTIAVAAYWAAAGAVIGWLGRYRIRTPWVVAAVWVCADTVVARWPLGGFSWGEVGYAFHDVSPARAVAAVGGVTLVTYLAVVLNGLLAQLIAGRSSPAGYVRTLVGVAGVAAVVVSSTVRLPDPHYTKDLRIAMVQGNDLNRDLTPAEEDARYLPNSHFDLAQRITDPVDLIIFPESSMDADPRTDPFIHDHLAAIARQHHAYVLANATVDAPGTNGKKASNLDVMFDPDGNVVGTYAKRHLVPFGERVPFRSVLENWVSALQRVPRDYQPGKGQGLFDVAGTRIGTEICFESAFGYQVRPLVKAGAQMIVVSTNNRSYRRSANSAQHLAIGQMRAAETGRPVVQASISGHSGVIDANGVLHDETKLFDRTVVETTVGATTGETLYVQYGEWVAIACGVVVIVAIIVALRRRRRRPSLDLTPPADVSIQSRIAGYGFAEPDADAADPEAPDLETPDREPRISEPNDANDQESSSPA